DRLGSDHADRLAHVDRSAAGQGAPVALAAYTVGQLAGQDRADTQLLDAGLDDLIDLRLLEQRALLEDDLVRRRIAHVLRRGAAEDTAGQRGHAQAGRRNTRVG